MHDTTLKQSPIFFDFSIAEQLLELIPKLKEIAHSIRCFDIVIDANIIFGDLRYLSKQSEPAHSSTGLQDIAQSQIVRVFAPAYLESEIQEHLPSLAAKWNVTIDVLQGLWIRLKRLIHFCAESDLPRRRDNVIDRLAKRDPNDIPYVLAAEAVGADFIITKDKAVLDIVPIASAFELIIDLREYARYKYSIILLRVGSVTLIIGFCIGLAIALILLYQLLLAIAHLPPRLLMLTAGIGIIIWLHPSGRKYICNLLNEILQLTKSLGTLTITTSINLMQDSNRYAPLTAAAIDRAKSRHRPRVRRASLSVVVFRILTVHKSGLTLTELETQIRNEGYRSDKKGHRTYVRKLLRCDRRFTRSPRGTWMLRSN